jgi:hypothetical protein
MEKNSTEAPHRVPSPTTLTADDYDRIRDALAEAHAPPTWEEWLTWLFRALTAPQNQPHPSEVGWGAGRLASVDLTLRWPAEPTFWEIDPATGQQRPIAPRR